jgi:hypothetical protein
MPCSVREPDPKESHYGMHWDETSSLADGISHSLPGKRPLAGHKLEMLSDSPRLR